MYGYRWEKIDVVHYWDLKGSVTIDDTIMSFYHIERARERAQNTRL